MASSFFDDEDIVETPDKKSSFFDEEEVKAAPQTEPLPQYEAPGLGRRLYEQNVVIPVRAARHLAPFPETLQEYVIDPIAGAITGQPPEQRKAEREEYGRYLESTYPKATETYESYGRAAGGLFKAPIPVVGSSEGITEQAATRPESLGFNPETALNLLPLGISAPKRAGQAVGFIKGRPDVRQSIRKYQEQPSYYDTIESRMGGSPVKSLEEEVQGILAAREADRSGRIEQLSSEVPELKSQHDVAVKEAIADQRKQLELGTYEGDQLISAKKTLEEKYKATAEKRNKILDETQGEMPIEPVFALIDEAARKAIRPSDKADILAIKDSVIAYSQPRTKMRIVEPSIQEPYTYRVISPRQLNDLRADLQGQVGWGGHSAGWEIGYKNVARQINDLLDASIPGNNPLRSQIRQETMDYYVADDLFGSQYPLQGFKSAAKDPMKRRAIENLGIPEIQDMLKTIDYSNKFEEGLKLGQKPSSEFFADYLSKKKALEGAKAEKLPMTSSQAPSALESAMMETYRNPKLNAQNMVRGYAEQVHPEGPADFMRKMDDVKVLRDLQALDTPQGSRMVNLGRSIGAPVGATLGGMTGNPLWAGVGAGVGGGIGAVTDYYGSNIVRSGARYGESMKPLMTGYNMLRPTAAGMASEDHQTTLMSKLQGTKYENMIAEAQNDPKKFGVLHYMMSQRDPEYAALVSGEIQK